MAKYHISKKTGKPAICRAKGKCPLAPDTQHFNASNRQEANEHYEKNLSNEFEGNHNTKKSHNKHSQFPDSVKSDRNCNRKIRRLYSNGMNINFYTGKESLVSQDNVSKKKTIKSLVDSPNSDVDFITDDFSEKITREEIVNLGNPLKTNA